MGDQGGGTCLIYKRDDEGVNKAGGREAVEKLMNFKGWNITGSKKIKVSEKHFVAVSSTSILFFLNGIEFLAQYWVPG